MVEGPLKIWPFPIVNFLFPPEEEEEEEPPVEEEEEEEVPPPPPEEPKEYNIKDHRIISGSPNYTAQYDIRADGDSTPWEIKFSYNTVINRVIYFENGKVRDAKTVEYERHERMKLTQNFIDSMKKYNDNVLFRQLDPTGEMGSSSLNTNFYGKINTME